jgi:hypothetical protein
VITVQVLLTTCYFLWVEQVTLKNPAQYTPMAAINVNLIITQTVPKSIVGQGRTKSTECGDLYDEVIFVHIKKAFCGNLPASDLGKAEPKENRESDHEEGMVPREGGHYKVRVQDRVSYFELKEGMM